MKKHRHYLTIGILTKENRLLGKENRKFYLDYIGKKVSYNTFYLRTKKGIDKETAILVKTRG